jgi:hypothetical protein
MTFRRLAGISIAKRIAIAVVCVVAVGGAFYGFVQINNSQIDADIVKAYCSGAVSEAQYQGCVHHVSRARIDQLANHGDKTAINAENVDCSDGNAYQDGDC